MIAIYSLKVRGIEVQNQGAGKREDSSFSSWWWPPSLVLLGLWPHHSDLFTMVIRPSLYVSGSLRTRTSAIRLRATLLSMEYITAAKTLFPNKVTS
jgi:hypothetical protein